MIIKYKWIEEIWLLSLPLLPLLAGMMGLIVSLGFIIPECIIAFVVAVVAQTVAVLFLAWNEGDPDIISILSFLSQMLSMPFFLACSGDWFSTYPTLAKLGLIPLGTASICFAFAWYGESVIKHSCRLIGHSITIENGFRTCRRCGRTNQGSSGLTHGSTCHEQVQSVC